MIPNIAGVMATSPVLINSLVGLFGNVHGGTFTEAQVQTVLLTDAVTNGCMWAVHSIRLLHSKRESIRRLCRLFARVACPRTANSPRSRRWQER